MIVSRGSMRVFGGSLGRMILLAFAFLGMSSSLHLRGGKENEEQELTRQLHMD